MCWYIVPFCLVLCLLCVYVILCCMQSLSEVMFANPDRLRVGPNFLGYLLFVGPGVSSLRHRGRFLWWGGLRTPRYHVPLGCLPKKAGRPMGPATRLGLCSASLFVRFSGRFFALMLRLFSSQGLVYCRLVRPSGPDPCMNSCWRPFSLSLYLFGWYFG